MAKPQRMRELLRKKCFLLWIVQVTPALFFVCRNCAHDGMRNHDKNEQQRLLHCQLNLSWGSLLGENVLRLQAGSSSWLTPCPEVNHLWEVIPKSGPKGAVRVPQKLSAKSQMHSVCHVGEWQGKALQGRGGEGCWLRQPSTSTSNISRPELVLAILA